MIYKRFLATTAIVFLFAVAASAQQRAEATLSLNEAFFDALLDSVFQNFDPPQFTVNGATDCNESITVLREMNGVRTTVRFRNGKIYAPLAFTGRYRAPLVGCVDVAGWAETNIELEFDRENQRLVGRAKVLRVNLNATGGIGGTVIARLIQSSIDRRLNPVEVIRLDKMSFAVPVRDAGSLQLKAVAVRPEIANGVLNLVITYEFSKI
jgi:hypothetical protein